jgi:hypothetical protein
MATLAQAPQVSRPVVARIMIAMGGGEHDAGVSYRRYLNDVGPGRRPPAIVTTLPLRTIRHSNFRAAPVCPHER